DVGISPVTSMVRLCSLVPVSVTRRTSPDLMLISTGANWGEEPVIPPSVAWIVTAAGPSDAGAAVAVAAADAVAATEAAGVPGDPPHAASRAAPNRPRLARWMIDRLLDMGPP